MNMKCTGSITALLLASLLTACGGGGSDSAPDAGPTATAEGAYSGTITGGTATAFDAMILEDGQFWAIYGTRIGGTLFVSGVAQGQGASSGSKFTSSSLKVFESGTSAVGTMDATFVAGTSLAGTLSSSTGSVSISGTAIPAARFNYGTPAAATNVAGDWTLQSTSGNTLSMTVSPTGSLTAVDPSGCRLTGSLTPRASGKNVYNFQLTIGAAPCALAGFTGAGIGIFSTLDSGKSQLILAVVDSSRSVGTAAFGTR